MSVCAFLGNCLGTLSAVLAICELSLSSTHGVGITLASLNAPSVFYTIFVSTNEHFKCLFQ